MLFKLCCILVYMLTMTIQKTNQEDEENEAVNSHSLQMISDNKHQHEEVDSNRIRLIHHVSAEIDQQSSILPQHNVSDADNSDNDKDEDMDDVDDEKSTIKISRSSSSEQLVKKIQPELYVFHLIWFI